MRKTLAVLLSLAMVLSCMAGLFVFQVSAETVEPVPTVYAEQRAAAVWATATKATSVKIAGEVLNDGETKDLAELKADVFTAGTAALKNGELTLTDAAFVSGKNAYVTAEAGGLSVKILGADWYGAFQNHHAGAVNEPLLITADGHDVIGPSNMLRSSCDLIVYGDIGLISNGGGGYDCALVDGSSNTVAVAEFVLGGSRPSSFACSGNGAAIESRNGSIVFCGNADVTVINTAASGTSASGVSIRWNNTNDVNAGIKVLENASLTVETVAAAGIENQSSVVTGDSIKVDTTGTVSVTASQKNCTGWNTYSNLLAANSGTIHFSKGTILLNETMTTYSDGCGMLVYANNAGSNRVADGLLIDGTAKVVGYMNNTVTTGYRMVGLWANGSLITVKDDAELTLYTNAEATPNGGDSSKNWQEYCAVSIKVGGFHVKDNAKVFINGSGATNKGSCYFRFQTDSATVNAQASKLAGKCGLQVSGGQFFMNVPLDAYGVDANVLKTNTTLQSSFSFTGGFAVVKHNGEGMTGRYYSVLGHDPSDTSTYGTVENALFCSGNDRWGTKPWYYVGNNAQMTAYDDIDLLGLGLTKGNAAPFSADGKTFTVPAAGNYKITGKDAKLNGAAVASANNVVTAAVGDEITAGEALTLAVTDEAPTSMEDLFNKQIARNASDTVTDASTVKSFEIAGSQIRIASPTGLRFVARISKEVLAACRAKGDVTYGILIQRAPSLAGMLSASYITDEELTMANVKEGKTLSSGYAVAVEGVKTYEDDEDYLYYTAVIIGLPEDQIATDFVARAYVQVGDQVFYATESEPAGGYAVEGASAYAGGYCVSAQNVAKAVADLLPAELKTTYKVN